MSGTERTLYSVMGLSPDAPASVIKSAYRALAKQYHPDGSGNAGDADKFIELQEAYKILSDGVSRAFYDRSLLNSMGAANDIPDEETGARIDPDEVWSAKVALKPEIQAIHKVLNTYSPALANRFRLAVIDGVCDNDPVSYAADLDRTFFHKYFGDNPEVHFIARKLLEVGNRRAARVLNKAVQKGKFKDEKKYQRLIRIFEKLLPYYREEKNSESRPQEHAPRRDPVSSIPSDSPTRRIWLMGSDYFLMALAASVLFSSFFSTIMGFTSARALNALLSNPMQHSPLLLSLGIINSIFWLFALSAHRTTELCSLLTRLSGLRENLITRTVSTSYQFIGSKHFGKATALGAFATAVFALSAGFTSNAAIESLLKDPLRHSSFLLALFVVNSIFLLLAQSTHRAAVLSSVIEGSPATSEAEISKATANRWRYLKLTPDRRMKIADAVIKMLFALVIGFTVSAAHTVLQISPLNPPQYLLWFFVINSILWIFAISAYKSVTLRRALHYAVTRNDGDALKANTVQLRFVGTPHFWQTVALSAVGTLVFAVLTGFASSVTLTDLLSRPLQHYSFPLSLFVMISTIWLFALSAHRYSIMKRTLLSLSLSTNETEQSRG